jgi:hypothetical protein
VREMLLVRWTCRVGIMCPVEGFNFHPDGAVECQVWLERKGIVRNWLVRNAMEPKMRCSTSYT